MNKYSIKIIFTNHAIEKLSRFSSISETFIKKDIQREIYATKKERTGDYYMLVGRVARYIFNIVDGNIILITLLYRGWKKNKKIKYFGCQYLNLSKREIKDLLLKKTK